MVKKKEKQQIMKRLFSETFSILNNYRIGNMASIGQNQPKKKKKKQEKKEKKNDRFIILGKKEEADHHGME